MTIELSPETEQALRIRAAVEGATMDEVIERLLEMTPPTPKAPPTPELPLTPENDSVMAYLQRRLDEAANATPEEIEEANAEWEAFRKALDDNRHIG